jgi:Tfp pilus assembly protein PilX
MQNVASTTTSSRLVKTTTETITVLMTQPVTWQKNKVSEASKTAYDTQGAEWCMASGTDSKGNKGDFRVFRSSWDAALKSGTESVNFQLAIDFSDINRPRTFIVLPSGTDHTQALVAAMQTELLAERKREQELFMARVQGLAPVNHMTLTPAQAALAANVTAESAI